MLRILIFGRISHTIALNLDSSISLEEFHRTMELLKIARIFNPAFVKSRRLSAADIPKLIVRRLV
jgi:hypothetical protein